MKIFNLKIGLILASMILIACFALWQNKTTHTIRSDEIFGTAITIIVADAPNQHAAIDAVLMRWHDLHKRFHAWREGELATVNHAIANQQLPITLSAPLAKLLSQSIEYAQHSEGVFNPSAGKLFKLWGFHRDNPQAPPPSAEQIANLMHDLPTMRDVQLRGQVLAHAPPQVQFDFGAIAKGAALDIGRDILAAQGVSNALLNVGGNILAMGQNGWRPWQVLISPANITITLQSGEAVATSGIGARFYEHAGQRFHHIIDPRNGMPSVGYDYATAISAGADAGAISDAAATALLIAGDEVDAIMKNFGLRNAVLINSDGEILVIDEGEN